MGRRQLLNNEQNDERSVATGDAMQYRSWYQTKLTALKNYEDYKSSQI